MRKLFLVSCFMFLASCQFKVPKDPEVLIEHFEAEPGSLNPILATDAYAVNVGNFIYETLLELDNETLDYKPLLATSWNVSADHLQYTFYIRKGVKWQDGVPFTADDVVYSYDMIQNPKVDAAALRISYNDVTKVEALDEYTVRFTYIKPYFRGLLVCGMMPIVPKHIFDDGSDFNSHPAGRRPIGTGPFIFKEWKTKRKIVLEKNPLYWKEPPKLKGMVFQIIEDPTIPFQQMKKGEIDLAEIRPIQWEKGANTDAFQKRFNKAKIFPPQYSYIGWNLRRPFFSDKRVRHALSMLINKDAILNKLLFGHGVKVEGSSYIFSSSYDKAILPDSYDPEKAKALLDEAGWLDHDGDGIRDKDGVKFKFEFLYGAGSPLASKMGTMMREDFLNVGIVVEPRGLEFNAIVRALDERDFDAVTLAWATFIENDPYQLWHSSQVNDGSNYVGFSNPEADKLIEAIRVNFNKNARDDLNKKLQKILHDEQPYTFLFNRASLIAYDKRFTNVKIYDIGIDVKEWGVEK